MSRKRKYATEAERKAANKARWAAERHRDRDRINERKRARYAASVRGPRGAYGVLHAFTEEPPLIVPREVLMERDFRLELKSLLSASSTHFGDPPTVYSACYPRKAIEQQRAFAGE